MQNRGPVLLWGAIRGAVSRPFLPSFSAGRGPGLLCRVNPGVSAGGRRARSARSLWLGCRHDQHKGSLIELAFELRETNPRAAVSLRGGMAETLTMLRLAVPASLARTLCSTNPVGLLIDVPWELSQSCQVVAGRDDGAALMRRGDARGRSPVRPCQRPPQAGSDSRRGRWRATRSEFVSMTWLPGLAMVPAGWLKVTAFRCLSVCRRRSVVVRLVV